MRVFFFELSKELQVLWVLIRFGEAEEIAAPLLVRSLFASRFLIKVEVVDADEVGGGVEGVGEVGDERIAFIAVVFGGVLR